MARTFRVDPRPAELGGGWRLYLFEDGEDAGGGVFPATGYEVVEDQSAAAYADALAEGEAWNDAGTARPTAS